MVRITRTKLITHPAIRHYSSFYFTLVVAEVGLSVAVIGVVNSYSFDLDSPPMSELKFIYFNII